MCTQDAPVQVIYMQAGHFPKHLPLGDSKPTPSQKSKSLPTKMEREVFHATIKDTREQGVARHWSCGPGVGILRLGFEGGKLVSVAASTVQAAEALEVGARRGLSVPPPCPPACLTTGHVRPLRKRRTSAPLGCHRPTCQSPSCHKCHIPRKTVLGKFYIFPPETRFF